MFNYRFYRFLRIWIRKLLGRRLPMGTDGLSLPTGICINGHLCLSILSEIICFICVICSLLFQDLKFNI